VTGSFIIGDVLEELRKLPDGSVHCCVTSPPYFGLRSYLPDGDEHKGREMGSETTPDEYVGNLVVVFHEMRRVLRDDGVFFLNIGDSYTAQNLIGIPWRLAFALQADGWILRAEIVWAKAISGPVYHGGACMPESMQGWRWEQHRIKVKPAQRQKDSQQPGAPARTARTDGAGNGGQGLAEAVWEPCPGCKKCEANDGLILRKGSWRPTRSHEQVFLLSKSPSYFCDMESVKEPAKDWSKGGPGGGIKKTTHYSEKNGGNSGLSALASRYKEDGVVPTRNPRGVWHVNPEQVKQKFYAAFPRNLIRPVVKAGTSEHGVCPECGSPWVRIVQVSYENPGNRSTNGPRSLERRHETAGFAKRLERRAKTGGWRPSCDCPKSKPVPATVLDIFLGSGTTALVCEELGRNWIGIDLDKRNLDIHQQRRDSLIAKGELQSSLERKNSRMADERMDGSYVSKVVTNVKGEAEVDLGPCSFLVGKTGTGKSAILDALSLGLRGSAYTEGYGKAGKDLMALAPPDAEKLYARLLTADKMTFDWSCVGTTESAKRPVRLVGGQADSTEHASYVFDDAAGILFGKAEALRNVILKTANAAIEVRKVTSKLSDDGKAAWAKLVDDEADKEGMITLDVAAAILKTIDAKRRSLNVTVKAAAASKDASGAAPLSKEERTDLTSVQEIIREFGSVAGVEKASNKKRLLMKKLSPPSTASDAELSIKCSKLAKIEIVQRAMLAKRGENESGNCPVCKSQDIPTETLQEWHKTVGESLVSMRSRLETIQTARNEWKRLQSEVSQHGDWIERFEEIDDLPSYVKDLGEREQAATGDIQTKASAAKAQNQRDTLTAIKEALAKVAADVAEGAADIMDRRLNKFLPPKIRTRIKTVGSKGEKFELHVKYGKDEPYREFKTLSGGERATLLSAFAEATIPEDGPPIRILVINDVLLDPAAMRTLMKSTAAAIAKNGRITQAIFGEVRWTGKVPDGWNIVKLPVPKPETENGAPPAGPESDEL